MKKNIIVKKNSVTYQIPPQNVVYMEKDLRRIVIHLSGMASSELVVYGSFHDLIPNLDERFLYCHRSYIINMDAIVWMACNTIFLGTSDSVYMGRATYGKAKKIFKDYLTEKRGKNPVKSCENRCNEADFIV